FHKESFNWAISPTIRLDPGTIANPNNQGTTPPLRTNSSYIDLQFDFYSGNDDPGLSGVFFWYAARWYGDATVAANVQQNGPTVPAWGPFNTPGIINAFGVPTCAILDTDQDLIGGTSDFAHVDSLQVGLENQTRCKRFGATDCGNSQGDYWDNLRVGFIPGAFALVC